MSDVLIKVDFDNRVASGDATCEAVVNELAAAGVAAGPGEKVRDPITGQLIRVQLHVPSASSQAAQDKLSEKPGVAQFSPPIPPGYTVLGLDAAAGIANTGGMKSSSAAATAGIATSSISAECRRPDFGGATPMGILRTANFVASDATKTYSPQSSNPDPSQNTWTTLTIQNADDTAVMAIANGAVTLTDAAGTPLAISLNATINLPAASIGAGGVVTPSSIGVWVDAAGLFYVFSTTFALTTSTGNTVPANYNNFDLAAAVGLGSL